MKRLKGSAISLHCWQGDDVGGFETAGAELSGGGIQATGNYPGKARTIDELRGDIEKALSMIPGSHCLNLHACYLDNGGKFVSALASWGIAMLAAMILEWTGTIWAVKRNKSE